MSNQNRHVTPDDIRAQIRNDSKARQQLDSLKKLHASEDVLLGMLVVLANYSPSWDAFEVHTADESGPGLDRRQIRAAVKKIREASALIDRTRWLLYTKDLTQLAEADMERLPQRVLAFANDLERALLRDDLSPNALSIADSALLMLMVYLKRVTGEFRDKAVCELLMAVLGEQTNETALNQWRYRHQELIQTKLNFKLPQTT